MRRALSRERRHTLSNVPGRPSKTTMYSSSFWLLVEASESLFRDCERLRAGRAWVDTRHA